MRRPRCRHLASRSAKRRSLPRVRWVPSGSGGITGAADVRPALARGARWPVCGPACTTSLSPRDQTQYGTPWKPHSTPRPPAARPLPERRRHRSCPLPYRVHRPRRESRPASAGRQDCSASAGHRRPAFGHLIARGRVTQAEGQTPTMPGRAPPAASPTRFRRSAQNNNVAREGPEDSRQGLPCIHRRRFQLRRDVRPRGATVIGAVPPRSHPCSPRARVPPQSCTTHPHLI